MAALSLPVGTPIAGVLARLTHPKRQGAGYVARCPAHDDSTPSLSVSVGASGAVVLHCHAGCTTEAVVGALGLTMADLWPAKAEAIQPVQRRVVQTYDYTDADGVLLYQVLRYEPKDFRVRRPDPTRPANWLWSVDATDRVLYRLPDVIDALAHDRRVWIVEGERDADAMVREQAPGTATTSGGSQSWRPEFAELFRGATDVVILPDNDAPGQAYAEAVAASLHEVGAAVRVVQLPGVPPKGDVSDWLQAGGDWDELEELVQATKLWTVDPSNRHCWRLDELLGDSSIMQPPAPVVPRLLWAGRSTLLSAQEKSGKSTLVGYLAAQVSRGGYFLGSQCVMGAVLLLCLEEPLGDVARRLQHFGAEAERIFVVDRLAADPAERRDELQRYIDHTTPVVVVVDTLMAYGSGTVEDENSSAQMQPLVQGLTDLAHQGTAAWLIVHHTNKAGGYRGSTAIGGAVDVLAEMSFTDENKEPNERKMFLRGRMPVHGWRMRYDGMDYIDSVSQTALSPIQRVMNIVRANPGSSTQQVRDLAGGRSETTDQALAYLERSRYVRDDGEPGTGHRWLASESAPEFVGPR